MHTMNSEGMRGVGGTERECEKRGRACMCVKERRKTEEGLMTLFVSGKRRLRKREYDVKHRGMRVCLSERERERILSERGRLC